jgi:pyruvate/2-oxoglutarate dehydrogenase complex dihydrolipoamide acyltransferase (E2) component
MIAKIIATGRDRREALARLQRALREGVVVIRGGASNKTFLLELLAREEVQSAQVHVGWMDQLASKGTHTSRRNADVALVQAAIEAYDAQLAVEQAQFYASAVRGRPQVRGEIGRTAQLRYRGNSYSPRIYRLGPRRYRIDLNGSRIDAEVDRLGQFEYWLTTFGRRFHVVSVANGLSYRIEVDGVSHHVDRDDGGIVRASAPAVVVSIAVKPGDTVSAGDRVAVLEAMKMEMQVVAPCSGKVRQVMTIPNVQVDTGAPLLQIEPANDENETVAAERVIFGASPTPDEIPSSIPASCRRSLDDLRELMLGFDVDPKRCPQMLADWRENCPRDNTDVRAAEDEILDAFVDICSLFQRDPAVNHRASGEEPSAEAHLFAYLRMLETCGEGLPSDFVTALRRVLAHYGVHSLQRSSGLEQSLLWIYKSHQRMEQQIAPVLGVLERRLERSDVPAAHASDALRALLDRMIVITSGRFPAVSDLAREVRYRYFDQPLFEKARKLVYDQVEAQLGLMAANPDAGNRHETVRALVECPQPLVGLLSGRFRSASPAMRKLMLEAITWRYYRIRTLENFRSFDMDGHSYAAAEYDHEGRRIHVIATHARYGQLTDAVRAVFPLIANVPAEHDIVIDFYAWHSGEVGDADSAEKDIRAVLDAAGFTRPIRRIVVEVASPAYSPGVGGMLHFTFRPTAANTYEEEKFYRGLHPMMGKRLHLWRLSNFHIERLPSVEDVYLLHAIARENPQDERLFACAEVRDVTPVRDESGRIVQTLRLAAPLPRTRGVSGNGGQISGCDPGTWTGTGGCACANSQSGDRRAARHGGAGFESWRRRHAHHLPSLRRFATHQAAVRVRAEGGAHAPARVHIPVRNRQDAHPGTQAHAGGVSSG